MLNFSQRFQKCSKGLGIISSPHFVCDFSGKIFLMLNKLHNLSQCHNAAMDSLQTNYVDRDQDFEIQT